MPTYQQTLQYLYGLQYRGMKLGLRNTRTLLRYLGHPERRFAAVHIAGTNGKGSTSAFLASIARESGRRTGLYTSPHLLRFTERIRLDGTELSEERLVYYVKDLRRVIESVHATFFEATTCVAFRFFADESVDLAVVETGLGGRFDATNVLLPLASVITSIGLDHTQYLGSTLELIAAEKGGIIKQGVPVIIGAMERGPRKVLRRIADTRQAPFLPASRSAAGTVRRVRGRYQISFSAGLARGMSVVPGLPGIHQTGNAQLAVAACTALDRRGMKGFFPAQAVGRGLERVVANTGLRGRMESLDTSRGRYILDVGHNPDGIRTLAAALRRQGIRPEIVVFGVMADKDWRAMLRELHPLASRLVAVAPAMERSLEVPVMAAAAREQGFQVATASSVAAGLRKARRLAGRGDVLVAGSHYVVAEALETVENQ